MRKVIKLTECGLQSIVKQVINEIGYRAATLATGANMKAADELSKGNLYYGKRRNNMTNCMYSIEDYQSSI